MHEVELAGVTAAGLAGLARFGVVVLAGCGAVPGLPELLAAYVEAGGRLLLIRPPAELAPLAGLRPLSRALPDAALLVEPGGAEPRRAALGGFPYEPLQVAGALDLYHPDPGTTVLARAVAGRWPVGSHPAIVERSGPATGPAGAGRVVAFLYDLPHTVARLRQGDPDLAGYDTDGLSGVRPNDAQQWQIDPAAGHLPQAEVHQALLRAGGGVRSAPGPCPACGTCPGRRRRCSS